MAKARAAIRSRLDSEGKARLYVNYYHAGSTSKFAVDVSIVPQLFNAEGECVLAKAGKIKYDNAHRDTERLRKVLSSVRDAVSDLQRVGVDPTCERVRASLAQNVGTSESPKAIDFLMQLRTRKSADIVVATARAYAVTASRLSKFAPGTRLKDMNQKWRDTYVSALKADGYSQNSIWSDTKILRMMLRAAARDGHIVPESHTTSAWMAKAVDVDTPALLPSEVRTLHLQALTGTLADVRDSFLIGCYTGLRFGDLRSLELSNLDLGEKLLRIRAQKTGKLTVVPLNADMVALLERRANTLPEVPVNQVSNRLIKVAALAAGLTREVPHNKSRAGVAPLHDAITMHTARRTFATNAFRAGFPLDQLMKFTGHGTEKQLRKYLKIGSEEAATRAQSHPFFR